MVVHTLSIWPMSPTTTSTMDSTTRTTTIGSFGFMDGDNYNNHDDNDDNTCGGCNHHYHNHHYTITTTQKKHNKRATQTFVVVGHTRNPGTTARTIVSFPHLSSSFIKQTTTATT